MLVDQQMKRPVNNATYYSQREIQTMKQSLTQQKLDIQIHMTQMIDETQLTIQWNQMKILIHNIADEQRQNIPDANTNKEANDEYLTTKKELKTAEYQQE